MTEPNLQQTYDASKLPQGFIINPMNELREFINETIDNIEGGQKKEKSVDRTLPLFNTRELDKLLRNTPIRKIDRNIPIEKNLAEIPKAVYSDNIKKYSVTFENDEIKTAIGSKSGAWTGRDERLFLGVVCRRTGLYKYKGKEYLIAYFTTYEALSDLNMSKDGRTRRWLNQSCLKLGDTSLTHNRFLSPDKKSFDVVNHPLFQTYGARIIEEKHRNKGYHLFVWDNLYYSSYVKQEVKYINFKRWLQLPDDLTRAVYTYLKKKLGKQTYYSENIYTVIKRIGILEQTRRIAKKYLLNKIDYLTAKKDFGNYKLKNDIITIYPTKNNPELNNRILQWLYMDSFNNWVKTPKPQMINKINTLIKNYGDSRIEELFLNSAEHRADPHPSHFLESIKKMEEIEEPITEQITPQEIKKLRKKAGI